MPKKDNSKIYSAKYMAVLNKFGVLPSFHFTDFEKEIVKDLEESGETEFLDFCDRYDLKPEKAKKVVKELVKKYAITFENDLINLTPIAIKYLHSTKKERKSYKKFRKFVNALNEKDLDEFMGLVDAFVVNPDAPEKEEEEEIPAPIAAEEVKEEAVEEVKEEVCEEVKEEVKEEAPKAPRKRAPRKRKPAPKKAAPQPEVVEAPSEEPKEEKLEEAIPEEINNEEEKPNGEEV